MRKGGAKTRRTMNLKVKVEGEQNKRSVDKKLKRKKREHER